MEKTNESLKLNEKYIDPRSLQKREVEVKQLEKKEQCGIVPGVQKIKVSQEKDSEND